ncbi:hypothetical protein GN956_G14345 [Arapaima gigas]
MATSKSSQTACKVIVGFLALWFIISLVTIIVWATSPDMKNATQCRAELRATNEKLEGAKVMCEKDRKAMEEHLETCWNNNTALSQLVEGVKKNLRETNASLSDCRREKVILAGEIAALQNLTEMLNSTVGNLSAEVLQLQENVEGLEANLTQTSHLMQSYEALLVAAQNQQKAAEKQKIACDVRNEHLDSQLSRCKVKGKGSSAQTVQPQCRGRAPLHRHRIDFILRLSGLLGTYSS